MGGPAGTPGPAPALQGVRPDPLSSDAVVPVVRLRTLRGGGVDRPRGRLFVRHGPRRRLARLRAELLPYSVATVELDEGPRLLGRVEPPLPWPSGTGSSPVSWTIATWTELYFAPAPSPDVRRARCTGVGPGWRRVAGVGFTPFTRASGRSVLSLAAEAVADAVERRRARASTTSTAWAASWCRTTRCPASPSPARWDRGSCAPSSICSSAARPPATSSGRRPRPWPGATPRWWWSTGRSTAARARGSDPCSSPGWVGSTATRSGTAPT